MTRLDVGGQRSEVKVTPWFKYVVTKACTLTLGRRRPCSELLVCF